MGFGLLFVGYFFANLMPIFTPLGFTKLVGYPMMLLAFRRLRAYCPRFRICFCAGIAALPFAVYYTYVALLALKVPGAPIPAGVGTGIEWTYFAFFIAFELLLLWVIAGFSKELHHLRTATAATRNMIFVGMYAVLYLVCNILDAAGVSGVRYFYLPLLFLRLFFLLLDAWLIFQCYRDICPAEEEQITLVEPEEKEEENDEQK